ncbi:DEAD/DEAH box helicase family protein [Desulfobotulus alkaliphilus]|nr:hypothetical protein [Desulfobotulus alkaliphilus]
MALEFCGPFINTPGEFLENRRFYPAPLFTRRVLGVVSRAEAPENQVERQNVSFSKDEVGVLWLRVLWLRVLWLRVVACPVVACGCVSCGCVWLRGWSIPGVLWLVTHGKL